jgi:hypothetical protein
VSRAITLLRMLEWSGMDEGRNACCPICFARRPEIGSGVVGHEPSCELAKELAEAFETKYIFR